jgi:hypothetical protein
VFQPYSRVVSLGRNCSLSGTFPMLHAGSLLRFNLSTYDTAAGVMVTAICLRKSESRTLSEE